MGKRRLVLFVLACSLVFSFACSGGGGTNPGVDLPPIDLGHDLGPQPDPGKDDPGVPQDVPPVDPGAGDEDVPGPLDEGPADPGDDVAPDLPPADVPAGQGKIEVSPNVLDFGYVQAGQIHKLPLTVKNTGTGPLSLSKIILKTPGPFSLSVGVEGKSVGPTLVYTFDPPQVVAAGGKFAGEVLLAPTAEAEVHAEIRVVSDDPAAPGEGAPAYLIGNKKRPCALLTPDTVDWGPVVVGEGAERTIRLESCGELDLSVSEISLDPAATAAGWVLDLSGLAGGAPSPAAPLVLAPTKKADLKLRFAPSQPGAPGPDGLPTASKGQLAVKGNSFFGGVYASLTATAVARLCANAVAEVTEGAQVALGTLLHARGDRSLSPFGKVVSWHWTADQPAGAAGTFLPGPDSATVSFFPGAPGTYALKLDVKDDAGYSSCEPGVANVTVSAPADVKKIGAYVVLSWVPVGGGTPQVGYNGPDVDLHVLHPNAGGIGSNNEDADKDGLPDALYDIPWDCFWYNATPQKAGTDGWGNPSPWVDDAVAMTVQSIDGLEPEVVRIGLECSPGRVYRFGAHFFDDHGYGDVRATLQVYVNGSIALSVEQLLKPLDRWMAGTLTCGTNAVWTPAVPDIYPDYKNLSWLLPE